MVCLDFQYLFVYFLANGVPVSGKDETILYIYIRSAKSIFLTMAVKKKQWHKKWQRWQGPVNFFSHSRFVDVYGLRQVIWCLFERSVQSTTTKYLVLLRSWKARVLILLGTLLDRSKNLLENQKGLLIKAYLNKPTLF